MNKIKIITGEDCIYCKKAKALLDQMMVQYEEIDVLDADQVFKTVPQIFINDNRIGGYTDLMVYLNKLLLG